MKPSTETDLRAAAGQLFSVPRGMKAAAPALALRPASATAPAALASLRLPRSATLIYVMIYLMSFFGLKYSIK